MIHTAGRFGTIVIMAILVLSVSAAASGASALAAREDSRMRIPKADSHRRDFDGDGVPRGRDCDDANPSLFTMRYVHTDADQDGYQDNYYGGYNEGKQCTGALIIIGGRRYAWGIDRSCFRVREGYYFLIDAPLGYDTRSC